MIRPASGSTARSVTRRRGPWVGAGPRREQREPLVRARRPSERREPLARAPRPSARRVPPELAPPATSGPGPRGAPRAARRRSWALARWVRGLAEEYRVQEAPERRRVEAQPIGAPVAPPEGMAPARTQPVAPIPPSEPSWRAKEAPPVVCARL